MNKTTVIIGIVLLFGAVGYLLVSRSRTPVISSGQDTGQQPISLAGIPNDNTPSPVSQDIAPVKEFTVTGANYTFSPNTIMVNQGDIVNITFKNAEGMHDFVIDAFNVRTDKIQSGQEATVRFTADKKGIFEFYCSVGTHRQMGMKGVLQVL